MTNIKTFILILALAAAVTATAQPLTSIRLANPGSAPNAGDGDSVRYAVMLFNTNFTALSNSAAALPSIYATNTYLGVSNALNFVTATNGAWYSWLSNANAGQFSLSNAAIVEANALVATNTATATNGFVLVQSLSIPTNAVPPSSASATNWLLLVNTNGVPSLVATNFNDSPAGQAFFIKSL